MRGTLYQLKPRFQQLLRPLVAGLARLGVTPNQITVLALLLSLAWGLAVLWQGPTRLLLLGLPALMLLRMALNAIDGMLAREHELCSPLGAVLNETGDVLSDAALYLPFALIAAINPVLVILFVVLAMLSEMSAVVCQTLGASRRYDGPLGKSDRALVFAVLALLLGLDVAPGPWLNAVLLVLALLCAWTIVNRVVRGLAEVRAQ